MERRVGLGLTPLRQRAAWIPVRPVVSSRWRAGWIPVMRVAGFPWRLAEIPAGPVERLRERAALVALPVDLKARGSSGLLRRREGEKAGRRARFEEAGPVRAELLQRQGRDASPSHRVARLFHALRTQGSSNVRPAA